MKKESAYKVYKNAEKNTITAFSRFCKTRGTSAGRQARADLWAARELESMAWQMYLHVLAS